MTVTRRMALAVGGGLVAALALPAVRTRGEEAAIVEMRGRGAGAHVWFDPVGLHVRPGQTVRWINRDAGNAHTATAYHPANFDRPRRMPAGAAPWDSDYLLPEEAFAVTLTVEGVYDYYCIPHEQAGMVGRIVVGEPRHEGWPSGDLPAAARDGFPPVAEILARGAVRPD